MMNLDGRLLGWVVLHMNGPKWSMWDGEVHRDIDSAVTVLREAQDRTPCCFVAEVRVSEGDHADAMSEAFNALDGIRT